MTHWGDNVRIYSFHDALDYGAMTPQKKLRIANVLMMLGAIPLLSNLGWTLSLIAAAQQPKRGMDESDTFLMIASLVATYAFALVVSGASALWSVILAKRNADLHSSATPIIRALICAILFAPLLWYLGMPFLLR
jgi:hypothetical protein